MSIHDHSWTQELFGYFLERIPRSLLNPYLGTPQKNIETMVGMVTILLRLRPTAMTEILDALPSTAEETNCPIRQLLDKQMILLMEEILHQLIRSLPTIYKAFSIPGGAGFLPSTVGMYQQR